MVKGGSDSGFVWLPQSQQLSVRDLVAGPPTTDKFNFGGLTLNLGPTPPPDFGGFFAPKFPDFVPVLPSTHVGIESFDTESIYDFNVDSIVASTVPLPGALWMLGAALGALCRIQRRAD